MLLESALARLLAPGGIRDSVVVLALNPSLCRAVGMPTSRFDRFLRRLRQSQPLPIRSCRPAWMSASRTVNQFSGWKNCIKARCIFRSRSPLAMKTSYFVNGSIPL